MPIIVPTTVGVCSRRIFPVGRIPRRKLPVDDHWRPVGLHNDVLPLKVVVGEDSRAITTKDSRQDMLVVPSLVGRSLARFEGVYPNDAIDQFILG